MYRGRLWTMRQYAGFGTAAESNQRYRYLLSQGVSGLSVAFDLPTQIGYDSDHPLAAGEVGRVGVAIDSIEDMATLFDGIPLDKVSTSMTINATAIILLALYVAVGKRQGVAPKQLSGTIQNDILKEYIARGTYIYPPHQSLRIVTDIFAFCEREVPQWNTISISGYHIREAGSTAVQEVAFTFANAIAYVQAAIDAGLDVNSFGQRLSFFFNAHNDFLEEVAKFRAARRLWARIMKDRFGATNPRAQQLRFHTQTAGQHAHRAAARQQHRPRRRCRRCRRCSAARSRCTPTAATRRWRCRPRTRRSIALRTQQIIGFESGVANTVDPFAGSYHIEKLTNEIEAGARELIARIEGGGRHARGHRGRLHPAAGAGVGLQGAAGRRRRRGGGGGRQPLPDRGCVDASRCSRSIRSSRRSRCSGCSRCAQVRDQGRWQAALDEVGRAAATTDNLVPPIVAAVESHATVGRNCRYTARCVWRVPGSEP